MPFKADPSDSRGEDPLLFTPGPLTTSMSIKRAMLKDLGSRDPTFMRFVSEIRRSLLKLGGVSSDASVYECVLMQGSGTFGVESVIGSSVPKQGGKLLVAVNGAYGERMLQMARTLAFDSVAVTFHEREPVNVATVMEAVRKDPSITHVAVVHHETTAGVLNDIHGLGVALNAYCEARNGGSSASSAAPPASGQNSRRKITYIVDSMSAFGAYPVDLDASKIDFLVSSSNKCIEGVPGFSFVLANKTALEACKGNARSLSLDLFAQWAGLNSNGQFRFTPPTHTILAFRQALLELEAEGGTEARLKRYEANARALWQGMARLGFRPYVDSDSHGCIITTFLVPDDANFNFNTLYNSLEKRGFVIYPGKTTKVDSFRLGTIGRMYPHDIEQCVSAVEAVLREMRVTLPITQKQE